MESFVKSSIHRTKTFKSSLKSQNKYVKKGNQVSFDHCIKAKAAAVILGAGHIPKGYSSKKFLFQQVFYSEGSLF